MHALRDLRLFAVLILQAVKWLDENFARVICDLRDKCPGASDVWLADTIVTSAISGMFETRQSHVEEKLDG